MQRNLAARVSRSLPQLNRHVFTRSSSRALPIANARHAGLAHRSTWNIAPRTRVMQANTRYAHTDAGPAKSGGAILDATSFKGSVITEKHWKNQGSPVVDALIEPRAILHFMGFITQGVLPNGKKTDLALLEPDEFPLFMNPTSEWAPAPFNKATVPTVQKAMERIAGPEDLSGLTQVGHNINFLKSRLWGGLDPVPTTQWRDKELNNPEHFTIAHEYLTSVIAVFEYLNIPQIQKNMRDTFNNVSADLGEMQEALNARRKEQGVFAPELNLPALWEQFIRAQYEVMTSTAHSWVLARAAELRAPIVEKFASIPTETPHTPEMVTLSARWNDLLAVVSMADFKIWLPMNGYTGHYPPSEVVAGLHNPDLANQEQSQDFSKLLIDRFAQRLDAARVQGPSAKNPNVPRHERLLMSSDLQDELRLKTRGQSPSPKPPMQPWIQQLLRGHQQIMSMDPQERKGLGFGIAIYRASKEISEDDWEELRRRVEAHLSAWGEDVLGSDELKPLLNLHWFDCKELDYDNQRPALALRSHYKEIRSSDEWTHKLAPSMFLIVDEWAVRSYLDEKYMAMRRDQPGYLKADFQGHVLAVDPDFDENATPSINQTRPADEDPESGSIEYSGHMRIMGNLVWSELYPLLMTQSVILENLWLQSSHGREADSVSRVMDEAFQVLEEANPAQAEHFRAMTKEDSV